jgi:16S rRNA (guanine527-N7)-methyltransferase
MTPEAALHQGVGELALDLPPGATEQLLRYIALLEKWNRTYNLTAIRDPREMVTHHLLDSLAVVPHLPLTRQSGSLADVGSGAGLPGIPIAIARPAWQVTLNEANQKKTAFLRQVTIEMRLANVQIHEGRVEAWAPAERFAVVIARAFAELGELLIACRHLVRADGVIAAMTGTAKAHTGCDAIVLKVPFLAAQRHLVLCRAAY